MNLSLDPSRYQNSPLLRDTCNISCSPCECKSLHRQTLSHVCLTLNIPNISFEEEWKKRKKKDKTKGVGITIALGT